MSWLRWPMDFSIVRQGRLGCKKASIGLLLDTTTVRPRQPAFRAGVVNLLGHVDRSLELERLEEEISRRQLEEQRVDI
jgi:hypothetical protein